MNRPSSMEAIDSCGFVVTNNNTALNHFSGHRFAEDGGGYAAHSEVSNHLPSAIASIATAK